MLTRTTRETVLFHAPFQLRDETRPCAAGRWLVETEEEVIQGLSFLAWRRTGTSIRAERPRPGELVRLIPVDPTELDTLQAADAAAAAAPAGAA